ncbi:unnamed protein product [Amoebophrya sp. A25]|nr:unnamed protein product [Amoebophrya sp. A25]|eukprot:GSA25T00004312001.1
MSLIRNAFSAASAVITHLGAAVTAKARTYDEMLSHVARHPEKQIEHCYVLIKFYSTTLARICLFAIILKSLSMSQEPVVAAALVYMNLQLAELNRLQTRRMAIAGAAARAASHAHHADSSKSHSQ